MEAFIGSVLSGNYGSSTTRYNSYQRSNIQSNDWDIPDSVPSEPLPSEVMTVSRDDIRKAFGDESLLPPQLHSNPKPIEKHIQNIFNNLDPSSLPDASGRQPPSKKKRYDHYHDHDDHDTNTQTSSFSPPFSSSTVNKDCSLREAVLGIEEKSAEDERLERIHPYYPSPSVPPSSSSSSSGFPERSAGANMDDTVNSEEKELEQKKKWLQQNHFESLNKLEEENETNAAGFSSFLQSMGIETDDDDAPQPPKNQYTPAPLPFAL